jgi:hypothetical protein
MSTRLRVAGPTALLLVTFHDACGAVARGDSGPHGSAWGR